MSTPDPSQAQLRPCHLKPYCQEFCKRNCNHKWVIIPLICTISSVLSCTIPCTTRPPSLHARYLSRPPLSYALHSRALLLSPLAVCALYGRYPPPPSHKSPLLSSSSARHLSPWYSAHSVPKTKTDMALVGGDLALTSEIPQRHLQRLRPVLPETNRVTQPTLSTSPRHFPSRSPFSMHQSPISARSFGFQFTQERAEISMRESIIDEDDITLFIRTLLEKWTNALLLNIMLTVYLRLPKQSANLQSISLIHHQKHLLIPAHHWLL